MISVLLPKAKLTELLLHISMDDVKYQNIGVITYQHLFLSGVISYNLV